ncbi:uncharacterized protein CTHT_0015890 [Thermochaetoides thermophila DSM 1495]|uniref:Kinetochore protein n=1 Tax=Chaetomium thermophilum (strain DSM 1495 / CBS 144.50 / IMI 039719) TaxID=759272 RepID=G0S240_CHATD|nr:hypothetical protein CTHT_0015890 [Thermochaetoides thermophila DSM 1495]EGS23100.1 hypothetical protein CTHT_0015890 [Thermochaetoides thermophila DSM 1495]
MAPSGPNQKKKRGRPPAAARAAAASQQQPKTKQSEKADASMSSSPELRQQRRQETRQQQQQEPSSPVQEETGRRTRAQKRGSDDSPAQAQKQGAGTKKTARATQEVEEPSHSVPKKRGHPPKQSDEQEGESRTEDRPSKRVRGEQGEKDGGREKKGSARDTKAATKQAQGATAAEEEGQPARGGRRKAQTQESPAQVPKDRDAEGEKQISRRSRGRKKEAEKPAEQPSLAESVPRRGRRQAQPAQEEPETEEEAAPRRRRRGRQSLAEVPVSKVQNQAPSPAHEEEAQGKTERGSGRPSRTSAASQDEPEPESSRSKPESSKPESPAPRTQQPLAEEEEQEPSSEDEELLDPLEKHRHLAPIPRNIPRATITARWKPLDGASIAAVDTIVSDAARTVLHRLRDRDVRHAQAQTILKAFATRLRGKLSKGIPFPPSAVGPSYSATSSAKGKKSTGKEGKAAMVEFDFEQTVEAIRRAERALDPALHSVALLERELSREEAALEREYKVLKTLETNAKAEAREWRERGKREHVLLVGGPGFGAAVGEKDGKEEGEKLEIVGRREGEAVFKDLQNDDELFALSQQVVNHMESIRSNLGQIDGVLPAIERSKAALQATLAKYLDREQYEQVVLGTS